VFDELRAIQREFGYLPVEQLHLVSQRLKIPVSQIHTVVSFYPHFRLTPPPKLDVRVCTDMTCHLRGASQLQARLRSEFRNKSSDEFTLRDVSCLGRCDCAPAFSVNDQIYAGLPVDQIIELLRSGASAPTQTQSDRLQPAQPLGTDPYGGSGEYRAVKRFLETSDYAGVIATLKASGLRGLGGAGFPTGMKWEIVRNAPGKQKYIVCNADESEPGTIKDRFIMQHLPYLVIEGMVMAGLVTGATKGYLYIRHEYEEPREILQKEIERCYRERILGKNILGSERTFDLEIFVSPGGYICGEESALLEALEGKRAEPRNKPPFPGTNGLWNMPTAINNVETFTFAAAILVRGVEWFKAQGVNGSTGLKFVGISGDVVHPGAFEVPMGTSYRDLIFKYAGGVVDGRRLLAFAPSGPSSGYLPASKLDLPLDFKAVADAGSMVGSGAIVVCADNRCMLDMALNSVRFFRNESCGKCVPCRVGSQKLVTILSAWSTGESKPGDKQLCEELFEAMRKTSICGLGQILPAPITSVMQHFPQVIDDHLHRKRCPAGVCFQPVAVM
jgi:NADH:ubiquinone oxidoreductase subunit F (NADH-binding)/NADH:ubiquinone oxidoreductase subunit E